MFSFEREVAAIIELLPSCNDHMTKMSKNKTESDDVLGRFMHDDIK